MLRARGDWSIDAFTRAQFIAWSNHPRFNTLLANTRRSILEMFQQHPRVNVAVSGGKDSLVMLDLAIHLNPLCVVWHWDYGIYMPRPLEEEVLKVLQEHFHLRTPQLTVDKRMSQDPESSAGYRAFFKAISTHLERYDITLNLIGLRSEESCARKRRCRNATEQQGTVTNFFPLRGWRWKDIWAYLISHGIPYPSPYDLRGPFLGWDKVRFVTFFDPEFEHLGGMVQDKFFFWRERN